MLCSTYNSLTERFRVAQDDVHYFHRQNRSMHGVSEREASRLREQAQQTVLNLPTEIRLHVSICDACKRDNAPTEPPFER